MMMAQHLFFMSFFSLFIGLNFLMLLENVTSSIDPHYVHHDCTSNISYASEDSIYYEANLKSTLLETLPTEASSTGFGLFGHVGDLGIYQIYSMGYCRGDIKGQDCRKCLEAAGRTIMQRCHQHLEGIIWYEECTLRYSNLSAVWSSDEVTPSYRYYNSSSFLKNLNQHELTYKKLMNDLIIQVARYDHTGMVQGFATGENPLSLPAQNMTLHCLVQCRPDVLYSCEECLRSALKQMDQWSITMVFLPYCNLRFDLYQTQISTTAIGGGRSVPQKVFISVVSFASVVLLNF